MNTMFQCYCGCSVRTARHRDQAPRSPNGVGIRGLLSTPAAHFDSAERAVLETVDLIDSSRRQRPADGRQGAVAGALRAFAFATSDDAAQDAYHRVLWAVGNNHRGSFFPIVLDAVPFFARSSRPARHGPARGHSTFSSTRRLIWAGPGGGYTGWNSTRQSFRLAPSSGRRISLTLQRLMTDSSAPEVQPWLET